MLPPEPFSRWLFRSELRERDGWYARELDAAHERISRKGEAAGPGKTVGTSAIECLERVPRVERERIMRAIIAHPGLRFEPDTEHPSEKLTLAQAMALARARVRDYT